MTYALQLDKAGPPALVLKGKFDLNFDYSVEGGQFTVVALGLDFKDHPINLAVGDRVFLIALPDAPKVR